MVGRKGAGYSLEAIVAVTTVIIFVMGGVTVPNNQDWSDFRSQVTANDLTFALQRSGYLNHALSEGEIGSVQTAIRTVSERNLEVSGLVSNLPIAENSVAFYTLPKNRFNATLEQVNGGCEGDLEEITSRSENGRILRVDNTTGIGALHADEVLYLGDLDPRVTGNNGEVDYDSLWVDNGTNCQYAADEGPYFLDEIFRWENKSYDIENIDAGKNNLRLFNATQIVEIFEYLERPVNSVDTFVTVDAVNFSEVRAGDYDLLTLRSERSLKYVDSGNASAVREFMEQGSLLVLANLSSTSFEQDNDDKILDDDFMVQTGFRYVEVPYKGSYSGGEIPGVFSPNRDSQDTQSYFVGLNGEETSLSIIPPKTISNTKSTIQASPAILKSPDESYRFSDWNRTNTSMVDINPSEVKGEPSSACYSEPHSLTAGNLTFPDGKKYSFINARLGTSDVYCDNDIRGIKVDTDRDNSFKGEQVYLNDQLLEIAGRNYAVDVKYNSSTCETWECLGFTYIGDRSVELVSRRKSFPGFEGDTMAVSGYEKVYEDDDKKLIASVIHWLRGDQLSFVGLSNPGDISTSTYSGIQNRTYLPYEINMRWSNK